LNARPSLRLLHTSDVHIGEEDLSEVRLRGLQQVVDRAIAEEAQLLLIAGDFFDNSRVKPVQVNDAFEQLARLTIPVVITNGNHDCLAVPSIYARVDLREAGSHVHFLDNPLGATAVFHDLGVSIWARGFVDHHPQNNPLEGHGRNDLDYWEIVMAHGHYVPHGTINDRSSPIFAAQIEQLDCDYLALGHWHRFVDVSSQSTKAFYSGAPSECLDLVPTANLVVLSPEPATIVQKVDLQT